MRTATIVLAGEEYTIQRMPAMRAVAWRKQAQTLLDAFPALADAYQQETDNVVRAGLEIYRDANGLVESLVEVVLAVDAVVWADRERLLAVADDGELMEAFQVALLLNAPLSTLAHR